MRSGEYLWEYPIRGIQGLFEKTWGPWIIEKKEVWSSNRTVFIFYVIQNHPFPLKNSWQNRIIEDINKFHPNN